MAEIEAIIKEVEKLPIKKLDAFLEFAIKEDAEPLVELAVALGANETEAGKYISAWAINPRQIGISELINK